jgi:hypothetical protein
VFRVYIDGPQKFSYIVNFIYCKQKMRVGPEELIWLRNARTGMKWLRVHNFIYQIGLSDQENGGERFGEAGTVIDISKMI